MAVERILGPVGPERSDLQAAQVACTIANVWRGKGRPFELKDFLLKWDKGRSKPKTRRQFVLVMKSIAALYGAIEDRDRR